MESQQDTHTHKKHLNKRVWYGIQASKSIEAAVAVAALSIQSKRRRCIYVTACRFLPNIIHNPAPSFLTIHLMFTRQRPRRTFARNTSTAFGTALASCRTVPTSTHRGARHRGSSPIFPPSCISIGDRVLPKMCRGLRRRGL